MDRHLETILSTGALAQARTFVESIDETVDSAAISVLRSRLSAQLGDASNAMVHARRAATLDPEADAVVGNLISMAFLTGDFSDSMPMAAALATRGKSEIMREIGTANEIVLAASIDGDLALGFDKLQAFADESRRGGRLHYEGVSMLNAALMARAAGNAEAVVAAASRAIDALSLSSSIPELASARFAKAWGTALLGNLEGARTLMTEAGSDLRHSWRAEFLYEIAELESQLGNFDRANESLKEFGALRSLGPLARPSLLTETMLRIRRHEYEEASRLAPEADSTLPSAESGHRSRGLALVAVAATLAHRRDAAARSAAAVGAAKAQSADLWWAVASLAVATHSETLDVVVGRLAPRLAPAFSIAAELVVEGLSALTEPSMRAILEEAALRPERWRPPLRWVISQPRHPSRLAASRILDIVGDSTDVILLRRVSRESRRSGSDRQLGRGLARRIADRVTIEDLGRIELQIGNSVVPSGQVRRKVLALLTFLVSRTRFEATREEVLDALWPELDPVSAANSLNQTLYFLRRVFEPDYDEETTAGYVRQESELVWLDRELVQSRSSAVADLLRSYDSEPSGELAEEISRTYLGRFALDFAYEDWASDYRDWLHVAYLRIMEDAIRRDLEHGDHGRGLRLVERGLKIEPRLEELEASLVRLLKRSGSHTAAAEQYGRYASLQTRDLGVDPPPFEAL
jgi:DNA-binding SARP family transcriptional activator